MSFDAIPDLLADILQEQKNTNEVVTRLIETIAGLRAKHDGSTKATQPVTTPAAAPSTTAPPAAAADTAAVSAAAASATEAVPVSPATLDYKRDVAPTFAKLLTAKGAPAVVAVLAQFGVQKGVELAPAQLADALAAATAALAE